MRFLYATDLHGNRDAIDEAFKLAHEEQVGAIVFGGDLTPKSVAIKLARYTDPSREETGLDGKIPLLGGEVLPTHLLEDDQHIHTFTKSLEQVKKLNQQFGSEALGGRLVRKGSILHELNNQYYEIESMLEEQIILDKLYAFFRDADANSRTRLELSNEEVEIVKDCVVEWLAEYEKRLTDSQKSTFIAKCKQVFGYTGNDFSDVAPSRHLLECVLFELSSGNLSDIFVPIENVLRSKKGYVAERLRRLFRDEQDRIFQSGAYKGIIEESWIGALPQYSTIAKLKRDVENPKIVGGEQAKFLREFFFPSVQEWNTTHPNRPVYAMLGNDDIIENVSLLDEAERERLLCHLYGNKVGVFDGDLNIVGYSFVEALPPKVKYRAWVKSTSNILRDLESLWLSLRHRKAIWVIHNPPLGYLDQVDGGNAGSRGVLEFLEQIKPPLALFGHIHEAPRLAGSFTAKLGETLCVNPGGEHEDGLQAVIINSDTLEVERKVLNAEF